MAAWLCWGRFGGSWDSLRHKHMYLFPLSDHILAAASAGGVYKLSQHLCAHEGLFCTATIFP